ncbi:MAG: hypothetical protein VZR27_11425 [Acutalibacteraceae bacterium]|nr:hypothetical protein [Acutalibacteraceae bacterium]
MKTLFKSLFAVCITAMLCCVLCCTASAESINSFSTTHTDTNSNNIQFGADITYNVPDPAKNEVIATITKCYKDEPVDIPETVSYFDIETGNSTDYKIITLVMEQGGC